MKGMALSTTVAALLGISIVIIGAGVTNIGVDDITSFRSEQSQISSCDLLKEKIQTVDSEEKEDWKQQYRENCGKIDFEIDPQPPTNTGNDNSNSGTASCNVGSCYSSSTCTAKGVEFGDTCGVGKKCCVLADDTTSDDSSGTGEWINDDWGSGSSSGRLLTIPVNGQAKFNNDQNTLKFVTADEGFLTYLYFESGEGATTDTCEDSSGIIPIDTGTSVDSSNQCNYIEQLDFSTGTYYVGACSYTSTSAEVAVAKSVDNVLSICENPEGESGAGSGSANNGPSHGGTFPVNGDTLYVDTSGSNNNEGSQSSPFRTIQYAVSRASPGDTVKVNPGTYSGGMTISDSGTLNKPIIIAGDSSDKPVIRDGTQCMTLDGASWIVIRDIKFNCGDRAINLQNTEYLTVDNAEFTKSAYPLFDRLGTTHHILIQNSKWKPGNRDFWTDTPWGDIKHGGSSYHYLAQSTVYGPRSKGATIIRNNELSYTFNAFRNLFNENTEVYNNNIHHVRDNAIEPEFYLYNFHIYHNKINNIDPAVISIDSDDGGLLYLYGNTGYYNTSDGSHRYKNRGVTGHIWKMVSVRGTFLDEASYILHNSWYNYRTGFKPDKYQRNLKHFNNAYHLNEGLGFGNWGNILNDGNEFDYDAAANGWAPELESYGHEKNGLKNINIRYQNPSDGNLKLESSSPLIDAGTTINGFTQSYSGSAPDIGAYEDGKLVEGPPFYIRVPSGGLPYKEHPRITRHYASGSTLTVYFSWAVKPGTINPGSLTVSADGAEASVSNVDVAGEGRKVTISTDTNLEGKELGLCYDSLPEGTNGQKATYWGATIGCKYPT